MQADRKYRKNKKGQILDLTCAFTSRRRVEFADTDMAGIIHFSRFFVFMEETEHAFWRSLGLSVHYQWEGQTISWPRLSTSCDFKAPVRFEDEVDICLEVVRMGTKSLTFSCGFSCGGSEIAQGRLVTVCCLCNPGQALRAIAIPDFIRDKIQPLNAVDPS